MSEEGSQALWFEIVNNLTQAIQKQAYQKKIMALVGATAFALGAAGCSDSESYRYKEPTPDATTSTSQEYSDPTIDSGDAKEPVPQEVLDMYEKNEWVG